MSPVGREGGCNGEYILLPPGGIGPDQDQSDPGSGRAGRVCASHQRGSDDSLSAPGTRFVPLPFAGNAHLPRPGAKGEAAAPNRFYMYGVIARLAMAAASYELEATDPALQEVE